MISKKDLDCDIDSIGFKIIIRSDYLESRRDRKGKEGLIFVL
jgi:hypothetical protein